MTRPCRDATPEKRRGKVRSKQSKAVMSTLENLGMLPLPMDSGGTQLILLAKFKPVNSGGTLPVHRYLMSPQDPPHLQSTQELHLPEHLQLATTSPKGSVVRHIHGCGDWEDAKSHYWWRHYAGHSGMLATKTDRAEGRSFFQHTKERC